MSEVTPSITYFAQWPRNTSITFSEIEPLSFAPYVTKRGRLLTEWSPSITFARYVVRQLPIHHLFQFQSETGRIGKLLRRL